MNITGEKFKLSKGRRRSNVWRVAILAVLISGGALLARLVYDGRVRPLFEPTPTATRTSQSWSADGETSFANGLWEDAVIAYTNAAAVEPANVDVKVELARLMVYSSAAMTTDGERADRLAGARAVIEQATSLNPDNSNAHAVHALVLDWLSVYHPSERDLLLTQAGDAAVRALQINPGNPLALAFYAEVLADQQKWSQAADVASRAVELDPNSMDVHRTYGYVLESRGEYRQAIEEYQRALEINPNLGFLYLSIGQNYRKLGDSDSALEAFAQAAEINTEDVLPYLAIGRTYYQLGEYFIAARNIEKALTLDPINPDIYGRLGLVYFHGKNYEGALIELRCAVNGCTHDDPSADVNADPMPQVEVAALPLTASSLEYYFTLSSVEAALSTPDENYCPDALPLMEKIQSFAPTDLTVAEILRENRAICDLVAGEAAPPTTTPTP